MWEGKTRKKGRKKRKRRGRIGRSVRSKTVVDRRRKSDRRIEVKTGNIRPEINDVGSKQASLDLLFLLLFCLAPPYLVRKSRNGTAVFPLNEAVIPPQAVGA